MLNVFLIFASIFTNKGNGNLWKEAILPEHLTDSKISTHFVDISVAMTFTMYFLRKATG